MAYRPSLLVATPLALMGAAGLTACATTAPADATPDRPKDALAVSASPSDDTTPVWATPARVTETCDSHLARAQALRDALLADTASERTAANTLEPMNRMFVELGPAGGWASLVFNTHPDSAVRDAAKACQQRVSEFGTSVSLDRGLFDKLAAVPLDGLDATTTRFANRLLQDFRRAGVDKDQATRDRLAAIQKELTELGQSFGQNVRGDVREVWVAPSSLEGLPKDYVEAHPADPAKGGKVKLTTDYPDFFPFQTYSPDEASRKALYEQFNQRGWPDNEAILKKVLALREEQAQLLGHPNWASYHAEDKMAGSAETIERFVEDLAKIVRPKAKAELDDLLAVKKKVDNRAERIEVWDRFYWVGKVREAEFGFDARDVRPYFPFESVTRGILDLYGELFGLEFVALPDAPVWHPSVKAFAMKSAGELLGSFYLDMHPREGKYKHAAAFDIRTGVAASGDSAKVLPMGTLVCNFPDPADGDGRALMEHGDVVTYFHEFGHLIHLLLGNRSPWVTLNGFAVEWDFVEAPSQLLEEWAWDATVLQRFAKHVDTGEPIPAELVARMKAAEEFGKGVHVMRQLFYTAYSFFLHTQPTAELDLDAFTTRIYDQYSPYKRIDGDHIYANFGHLLGYSSGYYTYQWSLVIAKDLFTRFKAEGLLTRDVAMDYRRAILEAGGTEPAADLVKAFLGREYTLDAYKAWLTD